MKGIRSIDEFDPLEKIFTVESVSNDLESVTLAVYERFIYKEANELLDYIRTLPWKPTGLKKLIVRSILLHYHWTNMDAFMSDAILGLADPAF